MEITNTGMETIKESLGEMFEVCGGSDAIKLQIAMLALAHITKTLPDVIKEANLTIANATMLGHVCSCEMIARCVLEVLEEGECE